MSRIVRNRLQKGAAITESNKDYVVINSRRHFRKRGKHSTYDPTDADRRRVIVATANGMKAELVAQLIINPSTGLPIGEDTLRRYYALELEHGLALANERVGVSLFEKCIGRPAVVLEEEVIKKGKTKIVRKVVQPSLDPDTNAIKWWEATRANRSEKITHQTPDGKPVGPQTVVVVLPHNNRDPLPPPPDPKLLEGTSVVIEHGTVRTKTPA